MAESLSRMKIRVRGFDDPEFDFQLLRALGAAAHGGGAVGEILALVPRIRDGQTADWVAAFTDLGQRLDEAGRQALAEGLRTTARDSLWRASMALRAAEYFADPFAGTARIDLGRRSRDAFRAALPAFDRGTVAPVAIPYDQGITLPGYLLRPPEGRAHGATLMVVGGFDSSGEELVFQAGLGALERGLNVLVFEGPGQTGTLRDHPDLPFRPDYEVPTAAALDFLGTQPGIDPDRVGLLGISFGGYFASRAASRDRRITALIANSPIVDLHAYMVAFLGGPRALEEADVHRDEIDLVPDAVFPPGAKLGLKMALWRYGVPSAHRWFDALEAYRLDAGDLGRIACPTLALAGAGEGAEVLRQYQIFLDGVAGPAQGRVFTAEEGADAHCQLGNMALGAAATGDWLLRTFELVPGER